MPFSKPIYHFIQLNRFYIINIPRGIAYFGPHKLLFFFLKTDNQKFGCSYCSVRAYLLWVQYLHFSHGSGTLILSTRIMYPLFSVMKYLHQRYTLFSMVHVHIYIRYKIKKSRILFFINLDVPVATFHN